MKLNPVCRCGGGLKSHFDLCLEGRFTRSWRWLDDPPRKFEITITDKDGRSVTRTGWDTTQTMWQAVNALTADEQDMSR